MGKLGTVERGKILRVRWLNQGCVVKLVRVGVSTTYAYDLKIE